MAEEVAEDLPGHPPPVPENPEEVQAEAAWGNPAKPEGPWYPAGAIIAAVILWILLPKKFAIGELADLKYVVPGLEVALLGPLIYTRTRDLYRGTHIPRTLSLALIALINVTNLISLVELIRFLLARTDIGGTQLLGSSADIWLTNVIVFSLWFWELDRGGPYLRHTLRHRQPDFLFPQMSTPSVDPGWYPDFIDYVYVAFTNATAFSPTDTMPLTNWAKLLMMIQSFASLVTVALVAARAVNILQ